VPNTQKLQSISPAELDGVLHQARAERWTQLVLLGPGIWLPQHEKDWPARLKAAPCVFQLTAVAEGLAHKLDSLPGLTSLNLWGNSIGAEGAKAVAAHLQSLASLDLAGNGIGAEGAKAIAAHLQSLTSLDLARNGIGAEGAKAVAAKLTGLASLNLDGNNIGDEGAKAIAANLKALTSLNLWDNRIGAEGAKAIAENLKALASLDLWNNGIGDEGAKAIAAKLTGLTSLDLWNNGIGDEGAKAIAANLKALTSLNLAGNNIGEEGAKAILDAWSSDARAGQLEYLNLRDNGDLGGLLPKESLETSDAQEILAAYKSFRRAQEEKTSRPLNEVKLLVVGNEAVGKTSLLKYMIHDTPRNPSEGKTSGIIQHEKIGIQGWAPGGCQVQLNVWDFGGQEMMRGTHRYFLTERSLYLLVLEDRREDDKSVYEWMKTICNRGGESPVIVVINKSDTPDKQGLRLDEKKLQEDYKNIAAFLRTSCNSGAWAEGSIKRLKQKIVEIISKDERLKQARDKIPANWLWVKKQVSARADQRSVLPHADFVEICRNPGDRTEPIKGENDQRALLRLLHELGTVVAYGLERDAPAARREIALLDPNWLTTAIYTILDKARQVDQGGEFSRHQLAEWLDPGPYPPERHEFILGMMQEEDIGLCFRLPGHGQERYLVPEALESNTPDLDNWPKDVLRFRYVYDLLPRGLFPRFIVQSHQNLPAGNLRWRTGVILDACTCQVLVLADTGKMRVDLQVTGPQGLRRPALNVVLNDLEAVHALYSEAKPLAVVPLPDRPHLDVGYEDLLAWEHKEGPDYEFYPAGAGTVRKYKVSELLEGVRRDERTDSSRGILEKDGKTVINIENFYSGRTAMGNSNIFRGISNSTIVNQSLVERSFNKVKSETGEETAKILLEVAKLVAASGNKEAGDLLDQFNEELAKPAPRKSLLKRSWEGLLQVLPGVAKVADAAKAIAKLCE